MCIRDRYNVVPLPVTMNEQPGRFYLNSDVPVVVNASQAVSYTHIGQTVSTDGLPPACWFHYLWLYAVSYTHLSFIYTWYQSFNTWQHIRFQFPLRTFLWNHRIRSCCPFFGQSLIAVSYTHLIQVLPFITFHYRTWIFRQYGRGIYFICPLCLAVYKRQVVPNTASTWCFPKSLLKFNVCSISIL